MKCLFSLTVRFSAHSPSISLCARARLLPLSISPPTLSCDPPLSSKLLNITTSTLQVSAAHGLARRWYRKQALKAAGLATGGGGAGDEATRDGGADGATDGRPSADDAVDERAFTATTSFGDYLPPLAIVRLRPDHLLTVSWNLTRAAMEFSGRAAAAASGGNFLALWGPTSHSETCGPMICPNAKAKSPKPKLSPLSQEGRTLLDETGTAKPPPVPLEAAGARRKCYSNGRLDDGFAFGTPQAMDGYAAPYHPYQSKCCEEYVTSTLPLAGLTQVCVCVCHAAL